MGISAIEELVSVSSCFVVGENLEIFWRATKLKEMVGVLVILKRNQGFST